MFYCFNDCVGFIDNTNIKHFFCSNNWFYVSGHFTKFQPAILHPIQDSR